MNARLVEIGEKRVLMTGDVIDARGVRCVFERVQSVAAEGQVQRQILESTLCPVASAAPPSPPAAAVEPPLSEATGGRQWRRGSGSGSAPREKSTRKRSGENVKR